MDFPELREAGARLSEVCDGAREQDGQGFNGFDSPFAKDLLSKPSWSQRQASAFHKMLRKYRKQLDGFGISYDTLPAPEQVQVNAGTFKPSGGSQQVLVPHAPAPAQVRVEAPNVTLSTHEKYGLQFKVSFPFDAAVKDSFRASCGMTIWEPESKQWIVPAKFAPELLAFSRAHNWRWSDDALFEAMTKERNLKDALRAREEATKASTATDSTFMAEWQCSGTKAGRACDEIHRLFGYQRAGAEYLVKKERTFLCDAPGLGKTVQALAAIQHTKGFPALVICPAGVATVWEREIGHWMPGVTVTVAPAKPKPSSRSIHITSYDRAQRNHEALMAIPWVTIVADESHLLKNREAKRTQKICGHEDYRDASKSVPGLLPRARYRYLLTGTPIPNRPVELIQPLMGIGRLQDLGGFGVFASRYCGWVKGVPGSIQGAVEANLPELNQKLRALCWVLRTKEQAMPDLPPKFTDHVPMALANPERYRAAARDVFAFLETEPNAAEALVQLTTLRRVAAEEKVPAALEWIETFVEQDEKIVVLGWHVEPLQALHKAIPSSVLLVGGMTQEAKDKAIDRFQNDPECKVFIGSRAAYEGITLTAAANLAFLELPWNPGLVDQAANRIHRIGQKAESVTYHYLLADGTIDEDIASLIDAKRKVIRAIETGEQVAESEFIRDLMLRLKGQKPQRGASKAQRKYEDSAEDRAAGTGAWI